MSEVTVRVAYFGPIRQSVHVPDDVVVVAAGSTVRQLVARLREKHGDAFCDALFFPDGDPLPTVTMLFDGRDIRHSGGIDTPIEGDRVVSLVVMPPPLGGG
jgi:molybdopterin converting factor small subunit